ncbi:BRO-N domain-containing protein [Azospirillum oryzae]|uniref:BRO-N domain-containing protein n=1 Tax=Azospirillum oryzae TaxID=286727 RepID=UPI003CCD9C3F
MVPRSNIDPIHVWPTRGLTVVSEAGLYRMVMCSDKPEARKFQDRVTRDVLPAIRKEGGYVMGVKGRLLGALRDLLQRPNHRRHQCSHAHAKGLLRLAHGLPDESLTTTTIL